jgi:phosphoribosylformylglycinamidine cyclo-ligase
LHSNGYSLARKIAFDIGACKPDDFIEALGATVGDALLEPTRIYVRCVRKLLTHYTVKNVVHGIAHITGGGLRENLERILPDDVEVRIERHCWPVPAVFPWLQKTGDVDTDEMDQVFNMGVGLVLVVSPHFADSIRRQVQDFGFDCWPIGRVIPGKKAVNWA